MRNLEKIARLIVGCIIAAGCLLFLMLTLSSCKSQAPTVVPVHSSHSENRDSIQKHYVYRDRWHTITQKGDTVYIHDSIFFAKEDTVYLAVKIHDTIPGAPVLIEKPMTNGARFLRNSGIALWILLGLLLLAVIAGIIIKFAK